LKTIFPKGGPITDPQQLSELSVMRHTVFLMEEHRQIILLALAELSIARPGWVYALNQAALQMDNQNPEGQAEMFEAFRQNHTAALREALTKGV
jgi:hypothetical protein